MTEIHNPHDKIARQSLNNIEYVKSTLYYIIKVANIEDSDQFIERLNNVPIEGEARGEARIKKQIVKVLLAKKADSNFIHEVAGMTKEEVGELL